MHACASETGYVFLLTDFHCVATPYTGPDYISIPDAAPRPVRRRAAANSTLHGNWDLRLPALTTGLQAAQPARHRYHRRLIEHKQAEFKDIQVNGVPCCQHGCNGVCRVDATENPSSSSGLKYTVIDIEVWYEVEVQSASCPVCNTLQFPLPLDIACWPATPVRPTVLYTLALLDLAYHDTLAAPTSLHRWCNAKKRLHQQTCWPLQPPPSAWEQFGPALEKYRYCRQQTELLANLGVPPLHPGACGCPGCWKQLHSVNADACMGLVRLKKAAKSTQDRPRLFSDAEHILLPDDKVKARQEDRLVQVTRVEDTPCAQFKAAKEVGRRSELYDVLGGSSSCNSCSFSV